MNFPFGFRRSVLTKSSERSAFLRCPAGFDGIACFGFLNLFTYGNFGDPALFGLER